MKIPANTYKHIPKEKDDEPVMSLLEELVNKHPAIGFWKCYHRLRRQGYH